MLLALLCVASLVTSALSKTAYDVTFYGADAAYLNPSNVSTSKSPYPNLAALSSDTFVAVWAQYDNEGRSAEVWGRLFAIMNNGDDSTKDGLLKQSGKFQLNNYTRNAQDTVSVAALYGNNNSIEENFVACWESQGQDTDGEGIFCNLFKYQFNYDLESQKFNAKINVQPPFGQDTRGEFQINQRNASSQRHVEVASLYNTSEFVVSWISWDAASDASKYDVYARVFRNDGAPKTAEFPIHEYSEEWDYQAKLSPFLIDMEPECNGYEDCVQAAALLTNNNECFANHSGTKSSYFLVTWTAASIVYVNIVSNDGLSCLHSDSQHVGYAPSLSQQGFATPDNVNYLDSDVTHLWDNYFLVVWEADNNTETSWWKDEIQCAVFYYNLVNNDLEQLALFTVNRETYADEAYPSSESPRVGLIDLQGCSLCKVRDYNGDDSESSSGSDSDSDSADSSEDEAAISSTSTSKTALVQACWQTKITNHLEFDINCQWINLYLNDSGSSRSVTYELVYDDGDNDDDFVVNVAETDEENGLYPDVLSMWRAFVSFGERYSVRKSVGLTASYGGLDDFYSVVAWQTMWSTDGGYRVYARVLGLDVSDGKSGGGGGLNSQDTILIVFASLLGVCIVLAVILYVQRVRKNRDMSEATRDAGGSRTQSKWGKRSSGGRSGKSGRSVRSMAGFDGNRRGYEKTATAGGDAVAGTNVDDESGDDDADVAGHGMHGMHGMNDVNLDDSDDAPDDDEEEVGQDTRGRNGGRRGRKKRKRRGGKSYGNGLGNGDDTDSTDDGDQRINVDVVDN